MRTIVVIFFPAVLWTLPATAGAAGLDIEAVEKAAGVKAVVKDDGVVRIGWKRDDVLVTVDGAAFPPAAGLGSWAAFKSVPEDDVMVMGDTVVFEDEITPAMDAAFEHGLKVTALHNHFTMDRPPVSFMHIGGRADTAAPLAEGVRAMWDAIRQVREKHASPRESFAGKPVDAEGDFDVAALEKVLGVPAQNKGEVIKFVFPRETSVHGTTVTNTMGVASWAAFAGNAEYASVDGDIAMQAGEVQPVMHALREAGIHIVALHNHMIGERPAYYFLHYWGKGEPAQLARGIRAALDRQ